MEHFTALPVTRCPNINKYSATIIGSIHWSAPAVTWDNLTLPHKLATMGGYSASYWVVILKKNMDLLKADFRQKG